MIDIFVCDHYSVHLCMFICLCILYIYIYIYIYIYTYIYIYIDTCIGPMHVYIHTCMSVYIIHTNMHIFIHVWLYTYMYKYIHSHMHTCNRQTHVCLPINIPKCIHLCSTNTHPQPPLSPKVSLYRDGADSSNHHYCKGNTYMYTDQCMFVYIYTYIYR